MGQESLFESGISNPIQTDDANQSSSFVRSMKWSTLPLRKRQIIMDENNQSSLTNNINPIHISQSYYLTNPNTNPYSASFKRNSSNKDYPSLTMTFAKRIRTSADNTICLSNSTNEKSIKPISNLESNVTKYGQNSHADDYLICRNSAASSDFDSSQNVDSILNSSLSSISDISTSPSHLVTKLVRFGFFYPKIFLRIKKDG